MIVRCARGRMKQFGCTKRLKLLGFQSTLMISVQTSNRRPGESNTTLIDGSSYERIEFRNDSLGRLNRFGFIVQNSMSTNRECSSIKNAA